MNLSQATSYDVGKLKPDVVILPVGSTEQHGPHAPLSTDFLIAESIASHAIEKFQGTAIIAPTVPYGISEEHRNFPGTIWLSPNTFRNCISDIVNSFIHNGWKKIIIVNGHGGNIDALSEISANITRSSNRTAFVTTFTWFKHSPNLSMGHAGETETSLLLHLFPLLVHSDRISSSSSNKDSHWGNFQHGAQMAYDVNEFSENGVVGDPTLATSKNGIKLLNEASTSLSNLLTSVSSTDLSSH